MSGDDFAHAVYVARVRVDVEQEKRVIGEHFARRHRSGLHGTKYDDGRAALPTEVAFARKCLREHIGWVRFAILCKALTPLQFSYWDEEHLGIPLDRWADDGGACA